MPPLLALEGAHRNSLTRAIDLVAEVSAGFEGVPQYRAEEGLVNLTEH